MTKHLIMTLGTGEGVENGLAKSIATLNPDHIIFLASQTSQSMVQRLSPLVPDFVARFQPVRLVADPDDVEKCAEDAKHAILDALDQGASLSRIDADFTSGTKAMTAGLSIAAAALGVARLVYVTGEREPRTGRVLTGTERVVSVYPVQLVIDEHRRQLKVLFNRHLFDSGLALTQHVLESCLRPDIQQEFTFWQDLFAAYRAWDRFDHRQAHATMSAIPAEYLKRLKLDLGPNKELLGRLSHKLEAVEAARKQKASDEAKILSLQFGPEILADLLANADRRAGEGKYDDAVARLYRAAELIAQIALAPLGINTSNLLAKDVPDELRHLFPEFSRSQRAISVGLDKSYRLLEALGDERAKLYLENKKLRNLLKARNASILAHGITPVNKVTGHDLRAEIGALAQAFVPDLEKHQLIAKATFPAIRAIF
jgi:CRISPR-associated protein (TIGR02710 family)